MRAKKTSKKREEKRAYMSSVHAYPLPPQVPTARREKHECKCNADPRGGRGPQRGDATGHLLPSQPRSGRELEGEFVAVLDGNGMRDTDTAPFSSKKRFKSNG